MKSFTNILVNKKWGHEFCIYETSQIGVWCLYINKGEETSLHCHPNKKTCLICLDGPVEVEFLSGNTTIVQSGDKLNIHKGVFHKTKAINENAIVLETESPNNKQDLVRLEDKYGRKGTNYEGPESWEVNPNPLYLKHIFIKLGKFRHLF